MGRPREDLIGKTFNIWTVLSLHEDNEDASKCAWECVCVNGHKKIMTQKNLKRTKHCPLCKEMELRKKQKEKEKISDEYWKNKYTKLIGKTFGCLRVVDFDGHNKRKQIMWKCECVCGNTISVSSTDLTSNKKDNCGCKTKEKQRKAKLQQNKYDLTGEYGVGYTNKGEEFYFDLEDYELIKKYCWNYHYGYLCTRGENGEFIRQHRLIMGLEKGDGLYVDHINHDTYDNRKCNLRICTNQENCMNSSTPKNNKSSGKSGITHRKDTGKWRVRIWKNYKCYNIGHYDTYEEAYQARVKAEDDFFGEFANLKERKRQGGGDDE